MLLEGLVRKYGKNGVVKAINEMKRTELNRYRLLIDECVELCYGDVDDEQAKYIKQGIYFDGIDFLHEMSERVYDELDNTGKLTDDEYDYIYDHPELVRGSIRRFFKNFKKDNYKEED